MEYPVYSENITRPYRNIYTNKIVYLTDVQAGGRDDIRRLREGEIIRPSQMPSSGDSSLATPTAVAEPSPLLP